jgi:RNase adapter protein RapZ
MRPKQSRPAAQVLRKSASPSRRLLAKPRSEALQKNGRRRLSKLPPRKGIRQFVLITGLSGAGKGSVIKAFEDLGFYCVDNLPADLILKFAEICRQPGSRIGRAAVVVDIREGSALSQLPAIYQQLAQEEPKPTLVFLEASEEALLRRFEETRRPHPIGSDLPVRDGLRLERRLLKPMRQLADVVISTTRMNVHELREFIQERFGGSKAHRSMLVSIVSFGFRFGLPTDSDLVFDVRFLPNPNYVASLKKKTGRDRGVREYMDQFPQTREFMKRLRELLLYLLPQFIREGKSYLTIALGCTGGRHRSVALAEQTAHILEDEGYNIRLTHRDIGRSIG